MRSRAQMFKNKFINGQQIKQIEDALSIWTNLGEHFVVRPAMRLSCKDGYKTHYPS